MPSTTEGSGENEGADEKLNLDATVQVGWRVNPTAFLSTYKFNLQSFKNVFDVGNMK